MSLLRIFLCCGWCCVAMPVYAGTADFENIVLPGPEPFYNGNPGGLLPPANVNGSFTSGGSSFNNNFSLFDFGSGPVGFWNGWAVSNSTNNVTPGFGNQYSAIAGAGFGGSANYAIGFQDDFAGVFPTINLPAGESPLSLQVTNTTYAYRAIVDGNDGGVFFARQFGDNPDDGFGQGNQGFPDQFTLTIAGFDSSNLPTGTLNVSLADFTPTNNALDTALFNWTQVDLTSLAPGASTLRFSLTTTDNGPFGANTPLFFALDNLVTALPPISNVPEPASTTCFFLIALAFTARALWRGPSRRATMA